MLTLAIVLVSVSMLAAVNACFSGAVDVNAKFGVALNIF